MELIAIIKKALDKTEGLSNEARAARIADFIEVAQELSSDIRREAPPAPRVESVPVRTPASNLIVLPGEDEPLELPRIADRELGRLWRNGDLSHSSDTQVRTIDEIDRYLQQSAPPVIEVEIERGKPLLKLMRRIVKQASLGSDGDGTVSLIYAGPNDPEPPQVVFSSGDRKIDVNGAITELLEAARLRYSYTERKAIKPKPAKPFHFNLDETVTRGVGAEADEADGGKVLQEWSTSRSAEERSFLSGR